MKFTLNRMILNVHAMISEINIRRNSGRSGASGLMAADGRSAGCVGPAYR
jgi:hypothetical protein